MALDFYNRLNRGERLFSMNSKHFVALSNIFDELQRYTGINIDEYGDCIINTNNQKNILKIIDKHIQNTNLNQNKDQTVAILEFRAMINYFYERNIDLHGFGD